MSSDMSDGSSEDWPDKSADPERSNPFETLSDDPILHIFSFLPGKDLLTLSRMDKNFNRIVKTTRETIEKIRLVLVAEDNGGDFGKRIQFAQANRITALKLFRFYEDNALLPELIPRLQILSNSVEDLFIENCGLTKDQFRQIIKMFLGQIRKCRVLDSQIKNEKNVYEDDDDLLWGNNENDDELLWEIDINSPLQDLSIKYKHYNLHYLSWGVPEFPKFFAGCTQLHSFETDIPRRYMDHGDHLPKFLAQQTHLKKLRFDPTNYDLSLMSFAQLEELTLSHTDLFKYYGDYDETIDDIEVSTFLKKLPNLKKLELEVTCDLSPLIMEAICDAPNLEDLRIVLINVGWDDIPNFEGTFQNHTVKKLRIKDGLGVIHWLLKMFLVVDSITLDVQTTKRREPHLELSDVPYDVLGKIEFDDSNSKIIVEFNPQEWPVNMESFESAVLSFASKHSERVIGINIGKEWWLKHPTPEEFSLSTSFCENLIKSFPKLTSFELNNVADRKGIKSFLEANKKNLPNLKDQQIFSVDLKFDYNLASDSEDDEPEPKKKKII